MRELGVEADLCGKVMILGELILTLSGAEGVRGQGRGGRSSRRPGVRARRRRYRELRRGGGPVGVYEDRVVTGNACENWADLLAGHFGERGIIRQAEMLYIRAATAPPWSVARTGRPGVPGDGARRGIARRRRDGGARWTAFARTWLTCSTAPTATRGFALRTSRPSTGCNGPARNSAA